MMLKITVNLFFKKTFCLFRQKALSLQSEKQGSLAEWLGTGLQNRLRRFESATNLFEKNLPETIRKVLFVLFIPLIYNSLLHLQKHNLYANDTIVQLAFRNKMGTVAPSVCLQR